MTKTVCVKNADWAVAWDHASGRAWIISTGYPETGRKRRERAARRLAEVRADYRHGANAGSNGRGNEVTDWPGLDPTGYGACDG